MVQNLSEFEKLEIDERINQLNPQQYQQFMNEYEPNKSIYKFVTFSVLFSFLGISLFYLGIANLKNNIVMTWIAWIVVNIVLFITLIGTAFLSIDHSWFPIVIIINLLFIYFVYLKYSNYFNMIIDNKNYTEKQKILENL